MVLPPTAEGFADLLGFLAKEWLLLIQGYAGVSKGPLRPAAAGWKIEYYEWQRQHYNYSQVDDKCPQKVPSACGFIFLEDKPEGCCNCL